MKSMDSARHEICVLLRPPACCSVQEGELPFLDCERSSGTRRLATRAQTAPFAGLRSRPRRQRLDVPIPQSQAVYPLVSVTATRCVASTTVGVETSPLVLVITTALVTSLEGRIRPSLSRRKFPRP